MIAIRQRDMGTGLWRAGQLGRFVIVCMGVWLHAADSLVVATLVPSIVGEIGGSAFVSWTISLYQIGAIVAGAATPRLCQRKGLKTVMVGAVLAYGSGCVAAACAPTMAVLLGARLLQGAGGGMLVALSNVAIQKFFGEHLWSRLFGLVSAIWGASALLGPLIGGVFADLHLWRWTFWVFAAQAAALAIAALAFLKEPARRQETRAPWQPLPIIMLATGSLFIASSSEVATASRAIIEGIVGAAMLLAAATLDGRSASRLFPKPLLRVSHPVGAGLCMVFMLSAATTGFWSYGPLILKLSFGTDPLVSGYILTGEALAWSAATMAVSSQPPDADRLLIRVGAAAIVLGAAGFALVVPLGSFLGMIACALLQGAGFGLCWPSIVHRIIRFCDEDERDLAAAASGTIQKIGYAVGAGTAGVAANLSGLADGLSVHAAKAAAFWVFAGFIPFLAVGAAAAWTFTSRTVELRLARVGARS